MGIVINNCIDDRLISKIMTELRHLQLVILGIMKDIDELCNRNGIEYYLVGGSAIGAIRHKGFIPWDDDLDIIMTDNNYNRFVKACREQLDGVKYYFQEGFVDWPMPFSKVKLRGTRLDEPAGFVNETGEKGIYIDIFKVENAPSSRIAQLWQYFCAKYLLCYCFLKRGWEHTTLAKRLMMLASAPLKMKWLYNFFRDQVELYNSKETDYYLFWSGRYRLHASFYKKEVLCNPVRVAFEDTELPVPTRYDEWLTQIFGDYMTPPPAEKQVGLHLLNVDFGNYQ